MQNDNFFQLLSGKIEYSRQWKAWERLCEQHGADAQIVLGLLNRVHDAMQYYRSQGVRKAERAGGGKPVKP